jgi:hypothetical protein
MRAWWAAAQSGLAARPDATAPKEKLSLDYLAYLFTLLNNNSIDPSNPRNIEGLRQLAEILIWGEKKEPKVFE